MAKRLALEVLMGGGKVSHNLSHASHLVVLSTAEETLDFTSVSKRYSKFYLFLLFSLSPHYNANLFSGLSFNSFSEKEKRLLLKRRLHVVNSNWLEDSLQREQKLSEDVYTLRPKSKEESDTEESE